MSESLVDTPATGAPGAQCCAQPSAQWGAQNMVAPLRRVMLSRPGRAMAAADPAVWHYTGALDGEKLEANHAALRAVIEASGAEILTLAADDGAGLIELSDAVFTHDPSLVTAGGAVLLNMGKTLRRGEVAQHRDFYARHGIPILGAITAPGQVEAGDCVWIDDRRLAVGMGFRTNLAGVEQLRALLAPLEVTVEGFDLPVFHGKAACLHLMSLISMLDHDLALVHKPLFPARLLLWLEERGITCLDAPADEFRDSGTLSVNVLTLAPRHCVMVEGFPQTAALLAEAGCRVETFPGDELCLKAEGGPTCLTRPLLRG